MDRVKYFHDRSAHNRAWEEKEILESEMARTTRSFIVMQKAWNDIGTREHENHAFACSAYAYKQAELYACLTSNSKAFEEKTKKKEQIYHQWYDLIYYIVWIINYFAPTQISNLGLRSAHSRF